MRDKIAQIHSLIAKDKMAKAKAKVKAKAKAYPRGISSILECLRLGSATYESKIF